MDTPCNYIKQLEEKLNEIESRPGLFVAVDNVTVPNLYMYMHSQTSIIRILIVRIFCFGDVQGDFACTKTLKNT